MSSSTTTHSKIFQNLIQRFENYKPNTLKHFPTKSSAVLICLYEEEEEETEIRVILTKRSFTLSSHPGEVALPGGKKDDTDSDYIETALREAHEEIGLDPSLVTFISLLDPFVNKKGMIVVPVIGFLHNKKTFKPLPNPSEVEEIFDVPLEMFLKDKNRREEEREHDGERYLLHYFDYYSGDKDQNFIIWALTAGILIRVASIAYQRSPDFQEMKPRFWNQHQNDS
ncbi:unnamed protein product [Cochlearia groenlandica]